MRDIPEKSLPFLRDLRRPISMPCGTIPTPATRIRKIHRLPSSSSSHRAFFTHMGHDLDHAATEATLRPHRLAYDGLQLRFEIA